MAAGKTKRKDTFPRNLKPSEAKAWLDLVLDRLHRKDFLSMDPLLLVHRYEEKEDQEVVALIAALFAFGSVKVIIPTLERLLANIGSRPAKMLRDATKDELLKIGGSVYYRFYTSSDITFLLSRISNILKEHHSLKEAFRSAWTGDVIESLSTFRQLFVAERKLTRGLTFMFADPKAGAAKRWHMFLRWMVRKDDLDLGLWDFISPSALILPLDTHLFKISRALKLTKRKTADQKTAMEVTAHFRKWNPKDPMKYDFALCRLGMLKGQIPSSPPSRLNYSDI